MSTRSGIGYDSHRLVEDRALILGGVTIPDAPLGLEGHSDADALTHAVIDALLGAAGLGDIGLHFPDTDERWRDANSIELLSEVAGFLWEHGFAIRFVDASVICEAPKLSPFRDEMRRSLAETIGLSARDVNVKFSTNERMGAIGRGEGIAAMAVATIERTSDDA